MKRFLNWCCDYWWIPVLVATGIGISILGRRAVHAVFGRDLHDKLQLELDTIEARREVREIEQTQDHKRAVRHVEAKYELQFAQLDEAERQRARELRNNPQKLAEMMTRLGR